MADFPRIPDHVRRVFEEILPLDEQTRTIRLEKEDASVRDEVERLLAAREREKAAQDAFYDDLIGATVSHYRIESRLGGGGMGVVYRATDIKLNRTVALKFLPPELTRDEEARDRFVQEAKVASSLEHPNICTVYDIDQTPDGRTFISMACYEGETLRKKIKRGPLPVEEVHRYTVQVAEALNAAHAKGIIHRDVKPANVIVTSKGRAILLDFGLAKLSDVSLTRTGSTLGTAAYMSPEQARGEEVDHRTDLWSLGVVVYEMLTGERPFKGESQQVVLYAILNEPPGDLYGNGDELKVELGAIVRKCLAKAREQRYGSVEQLLEELQVLKQETPERRLIPVWRLWGPRAFAGLGVLLMLIAGLWLLLPQRSVAFSERDWLLITDFENLTGEEIFDKSLSTALKVSIGQSRYVNVVPDPRVVEVLRRMRRADTGLVDAQLGLEIAQREGLKVILVPGISRVGNSYALTGSLRETHNGADLHSEVVYAESKDDVLPALDELTQKIRRNLGEALPLIERESQPLVKVTTASLDALKQYALGREALVAADALKAKAHFERALDLDSTFTTARASLGMLHIDRSADPWAAQFHAETGRSLLNEAVQQVDDLTDTEKYAILGVHAQVVEADLQRAADYYLTLLDSYPDRDHIHNNLARVYEAMGRYEDAAAAYKEAIRVNPYFLLSYNGLNNLYFWRMGQLDSGYVWARRHVQQNPDHQYAHSLMAYAYLGLDSLDQARTSIERALGLDPRSGRDLFRLARISWIQGRMEEAVEPLLRIQESNPDTWAGYWLMRLYERLGQVERAQEQRDIFHTTVEHWLRDYPDYPNTYVAQGLLLTFEAQPDSGWSAAQKALDVGNDPERFFGVARVAAVQGRTARALDLLEKAVEQGYRDLIWIKIHPDMEPLYTEPRFQQLMDRYLNR